MKANEILNNAQLAQAVGGATNEELFAEYRKSDGTYSYTCEKCKDEIKAGNADDFFAAFYAHIGKHMGLDWNIPNYYGN